MNTPAPPPPTDLAVMLSVMDRLVPQGERASPAELAARITQACAAEGFSPDPSQVQAEVTQALVQTVPPKPFDFGWDRPASPRVLQHLADEANQKERQFGWQMPACLAGVFLGSPCLGYAVAQLTHHPSLGVFVGFLGVIGLSSWGIYKENMSNAALDRQKHLVPISPSLADVKRWQSVPASLRYLRACLLSEVPLTIQDRHCLDTLVQQADQSAGETYLAALKDTLNTSAS
jgi:hypothetical protein